ncbi:glycosyltransferase [uncultured Sphingomonas sp.]|uniref:glycosyltransferase n=1 Tax=uncultured Sphingomonas sp. TaxID=158754 RepID=UPI0035CB46CF
MVDAPPRIERRASAAAPAGAIALSALFAGLALYACWSAPGLAERWGIAPAGLVLLAVWVAAAAWAAATAVRDPGRVGWAGFAIVAIAFRLASLTLVAGRESPGDPHWYLELARHLLSGQGLFLDDPAMGTRVYAEFPPAYPVLLAGWSAIAGLSPVAVLTLSTLLDALAAAMIASLGRRIGAARAGRAAAALYLIWPSVLFNAPLAQKESLELVAVLALAHGWVGAEWVDWRAALRIGLPAGLLALTQPGMAAMAALFGLAMAPRLGWRRFAGLAAVGALVAAAVMMPWWVRNWRLFHAFVPLTSVGGLSLWVGENPGATGNWMPYPAALVGLPELACSRAAGRLAIDWMIHHPAGVAHLTVAKFLRAAGVGQFAITRLAAMRPGLAPGLTATLLPLAHGSQFVLLAAGAVSLLVRRRPTLTALILTIVAQLLVFGLPFEFSERHREVLTPFLLLSIALGVQGAMAYVRRRRAPAVPSWAQRSA